MKNINPFAFLLIAVFIGRTVQAQDVYQLWPANDKPYYKENKLKEHEQEMWGSVAVLNVIDPTLTVYQAKGENLGKAVVILPGGGYEALAMYHEGYDVAEILSSKGITAAILKYRIPDPESSDHPHLVPISDTRRALALLREMSEKYGFNKDKVGVMGFSAGGHLSAVASVKKSDNEEENPNYSALIYGVTNLSEGNQKWLERALYHRPMTAKEVEENKLLDLVSESTPPAFLAHAYNDESCAVAETTLYAQRLIEHNVLAEFHVFAKGGHGFGVGKKEDGTDQWISLFLTWLKVNDF